MRWCSAMLVAVQRALSVVGSCSGAESLGMADISRLCEWLQYLVACGTGRHRELFLIVRQLIDWPMWLCATMIRCPLR